MSAELRIKSLFNLAAIITRPKEDAFPAVRAASRKEKGGSPEDARRGNDMLNISQDIDDSNVVTASRFIANGDFNKKLRWRIQNQKNHADIWTITPGMASAMLQWNDRNRPASDGTIKQYARMMREGRWHYTGEPIIFSAERLIDGQHRLAACVAANVEFTAMVVFGAPDEAFAFIDVGKTRTAANIFAIHGVKNHAVMAAATQWLVGYDQERMAAAANGRAAKDHAWLYERYLTYHGLQDSAWVAGVFGKAKIVSPSMMVAIHYVTSRKARQDADVFFRKVADGIGFSGKKDPAYKLHRLLVDAAVSGQPIGRRSAAALTIKAWNAARLGRDAGILRFTPDETFPKVV